MKSSTVEAIAFVVGMIGGGLAARPFVKSQSTKPGWVLELEERIKKQAEDHDARWGRTHPPAAE